VTWTIYPLTVLYSTNDNNYNLIIILPTEYGKSCNLKIQIFCAWKSCSQAYVLEGHGK